MFQSTITKLSNAVGEAIASQDWIKANRAVESMADIAVSFILGRNRSDIDALGNLARAQYTNVVAGECVHVVPSPEFIAAKLSGLSAVLEAARLRVEPDRSLTSTDVRILEALRRANSPMSGLDLEQCIGVDQTVLSRRLPVLELSGLIERTRSGKHRLNVITVPGRERLSARAFEIAGKSSDQQRLSEKSENLQQLRKPQKQDAARLQFDDHLLNNSEAIPEMTNHLNAA